MIKFAYVHRYIRLMTRLNFNMNTWFYYNKIHSRMWQTYWVRHYTCEKPNSMMKKCVHVTSIKKGEAINWWVDYCNIMSKNNENTRKSEWQSSPENEDPDQGTAVRRVDGSPEHSSRPASVCPSSRGQTWTSPQPTIVYFGSHLTERVNL